MHFAGVKPIKDVHHLLSESALPDVVCCGCESDVGSVLQAIPGNDTRVIEMMNNISKLGPEIAMSRGDNLHTSGHAYRQASHDATLSVSRVKRLRLMGMGFGPVETYSHTLVARKPA